MTYTPKVWTTGEVITADDLNLITPLVEPLALDEGENLTSYHTAEYIYNAAKSGRLIVLYISSDDVNSVTYQLVASVSIDDDLGDYYLKAINVNSDAQIIDEAVYTCASGSEHFTPYLPK